MREIEYRGKRKDNGEWIYGYLIVDEIVDKYYIFPKGNACNERDIIGEEGYLHILSFEVDPKTVGQYTGRKDENGVKIYEGCEILLWEEHQTRKAQVIYSNTKLKFVVTDIYDEKCDDKDLSDFQEYQLKLLEGGKYE